MDKIKPTDVFSHNLLKDQNNNDFNFVDLNELKYISKIEIFTYDSKDLKVVGCLNEVWFNVNNLLNILNYKANVFEKILSYFINIFKPNNIENNLFFNEENNIYINETTLYYIITQPKLKKSKEFQEFIYLNLLPVFKQHVSKVLINNLNTKDNKIKYFEVENKKLMTLVELINEKNERLIQICEEQNKDMDNIINFYKNKN